MNTYIIYGVIFVILLALELIYFKIADKCNIIDKPNERSSHSTIVLRGGGDIVRRQQDLRDGVAVFREQLVVGVHKLALAHGGRGFLCPQGKA